MEEKKIFDPKFVHFMWSDELKGKEGFVAPTIGRLVDYVENNVRTNQWQKFEESHSTDLPFHSLTGPDYGFAYHDPLYEIKWAWKHGKQIQYRYRDSEGCEGDHWDDTDDPCWNNITFEYRVKPDNVEKQEEPLEYIVVYDETETPPKVLVTPAVSSMPINWHVLAKGPLERCKSFAVERFCKRCRYEVSICCSPYLGCRGFKEAKEVAKETKEAEKPELQPTDGHSCVTCIHRSRSVYEEPCCACKRGFNLPWWKIDETVKVCGTCKYKDLPYSCSPCNECMENSVNAGEERSMWEQTEVKKRRWTNRELAQWVWQGNGQVKYRDGYYTLIACTAYDIRDDNKPCPDYYVIRGWDETEWHEPTVEEE